MEHKTRKKTKCITLGESNEKDCILFSCVAMDPEHGHDGFQGCDFTEGYKNRCPHKDGMNCYSTDARLIALDILDGVVRAEFKRLRNEAERNDS